MSAAAAPPRPWVVTPEGLDVAVRLTPKGGRDAVEGIETLADGRLVVKARVRAAASEGGANSALVKLLAGVLRIAPRNVILVAGASGRFKRLKIAGPGPILAAALEKTVRGGGC